MPIKSSLILFNETYTILNKKLAIINNNKPNLRLGKPEVAELHTRSFRDSKTTTERPKNMELPPLPVIPRMTLMEYQDVRQGLTLRVNGTSLQLITTRPTIMELLPPLPASDAIPPLALAKFQDVSLSILRASRLLMIRLMELTLHLPVSDIPETTLHRITRRRTISPIQGSTASPNRNPNRRLVIAIISLTDQRSLGCALTETRVVDAFTKDASVTSTKNRIQTTGEAVIINMLKVVPIIIKNNNNMASPVVAMKRSLVYESPMGSHAHDACDREAFAISTKIKNGMDSARQSEAVPVLPKDASTAFEPMDSLVYVVCNSSDSVFSMRTSKSECKFRDISLILRAEQPSLAYKSNT